MNTRWALLFVALCGLMFGSCTSPAPSTETRIAVASSVMEPMAEIAHLFEAETGYKVTLLPGSTGRHVAQIVSGAPVDALFGADADRPARLEQEGLIVANSRFTYAFGRLVLWAPGLDVNAPAEAVPGPEAEALPETALGGEKTPRKSAPDPDPGTARFTTGEPTDTLTQGALPFPVLSDSLFASLLTQDFRFLAIANPRLAPYGQAARQVLERLGVWEALQGRIARGENIGQTYSFLKSGNAEWGFIALSQVPQSGEADSTGPSRSLSLPNSWSSGPSNPAGPSLDPSPLTIPAPGQFIPTNVFLVPAAWHDPIEHQAAALTDNEIARAFCTFVQGQQALTIWKRYGFTTP